MAINLRPGVVGSIKVFNDKSVLLYEKPIQKISERDEFIKSYAKTIKGYGLLPSILCPMHLKGRAFMKDLFCPVLANFSMRINNKALRLFAAPFALFVDMNTLIARVVTTPIRALYLTFRKEKPHPLQKLLKAPADRITINIHLENVLIEKDQQSATKKVTDDSIQIAIKQLPIFHASAQSKHSLTSYIGYEGDWAIENQAVSEDGIQITYF